jgi:hypothetical protein
MSLQPLSAAAVKRKALLVLIASSLLASCYSDDLTVAKYEVSAIDGRALSSTAMERRRNKKPGCAFSTPAEGGGIRLLRLTQEQMPFQFPSLRGGTPGGGQGRSVYFRLKTADMPDTMTVNCWVPATLSVDEMMAAQRNVDWKTVYSKVSQSRYVSRKRLRQPMSAESRERAYEMLDLNAEKLPATRVPIGGATRSVYPPEGCDWTFIGIMESGRATMSTSSSCKCEVWGVPEIYGIVVYYYSCLHSAQPLVGMTSWGTSDPAAISAGNLPLPDLEQLDDELSDLIGCTQGCWVSSDVYGTVSASSYDGPGTSVHFTWGASVPDAEVVSIQWSYQDIDEDESTSTSDCSSVPDTHVCTITVRSDGYMTVDFEFTNSRYAYAEVALHSAYAPCDGNTPALDTLRRQYSSPRTMPHCELFQFQPEGNGGWPSWEQVKSRGTGAFTSDWAIFRNVLKSSLQYIHYAFYINIIPGPGGNRVYSTPARQDFVSASQNPPAYVPNGRHIYGDAADLNTDASSWQATYDAVLTYGNPGVCREPRRLTYPGHVHMDYRVHMDAIRPYTANNGDCPPEY